MSETPLLPPSYADPPEVRAAFDAEETAGGFGWPEFIIGMIVGASVLIAGATAGWMVFLVN